MKLGLPQRLALVGGLVAAVGGFLLFYLPNQGSTFEGGAGINLYMSLLVSFPCFLVGAAIGSYTGKWLERRKR